MNSSPAISNYQAAALFLIMGISVIIGGIIFYRGSPSTKRFHLSRFNILKSAPYGFIPAGVGAVLIGIGALIVGKSKSIGDIVVLTGLGIAAIGMIFAFWNPRWLKPKWEREEEARKKEEK